MPGALQLSRSSDSHLGAILWRRKILLEAFVEAPNRSLLYPSDQRLQSKPLYIKRIGIRDLPVECGLTMQRLPCAR